MKIDNLKSDIQGLKSFRKEVKESFEKYDDYFFDRLIRYSEALFALSPYKFNEKIVLNETPLITNVLRSGWMGYKNILVKGAIGTINEIDHRCCKFHYLIRFGSPEDGPLFYFDETQLAKKE